MCEEKTPSKTNDCGNNGLGKARYVTTIQKFSQSSRLVEVLIPSGEGERAELFSTNVLNETTVVYTWRVVRE